MKSQITLDEPESHTDATPAKGRRPRSMPEPLTAAEINQRYKQAAHILVNGAIRAALRQREFDSAATKKRAAGARSHAGDGSLDSTHASQKADATTPVTGRSSRRRTTDSASSDAVSPEN